MEKYDSTLLGILQNEGKVAPFLDAILGFLYRRTDYFRVMKTDNEKLGFPPGVARKLLMNIFSKYETQAQKDAVKIEAMKKGKEADRPLENAPVASSQQFPSDSSAADNILKENSPSSTSTGSQKASEDGRGMEDQAPEDKINDKMDTASSPAHNAQQDHPEESSNENDDNEEKEDPELARQRRQLQANPLTYNGAERDDYYWSQTITETDLRVKIPKFVVKGKQVKVNIEKKHIRVNHQQEDGSWSKVVDSQLMWEVDTEESMWTLTPGEFVHINLEKREERWWESVFVDEPKINTRKIDCSRPMTDLDDEAQAKIEEMMYNQRQKQLGLPQSHEQKTHEMLRKAWDAEGSPFKGQPFDPSRFNVDANSGVVNVNPS